MKLPEVLEKHLTPDFTFVDVDGSLMKDRDAYIKLVLSGPKFVEYTISDEMIRVHGSTAVATARWVGKDSANVSSAIRYTDTYVKTADGWKAIASQDTTTK